MATPDFIRTLRASAGNQLLWLPGVTALVFDDEGNSVPFGGGGYLVRVDPAGLDRGFLQTGAEWRSPWVAAAPGIRTASPVSADWS